MNIIVALKPHVIKFALILTPTTQTELKMYWIRVCTYIMFDEIFFRFSSFFFLVTTKPQARKLKESKQFQPVWGRRALGCFKILLNKHGISYQEQAQTCSVTSLFFNYNKIAIPRENTPFYSKNCILAAERPLVFSFMTIGKRFWSVNLSVRTQDPQKLKENKFL